MRYTKIQKFLSSFLIFSLLSGITFRVPFFDFLASASWSEYYDLVSIIVDEETYSDISSELKRYSKDITNSLENTKVVILPVPEEATSYDIASMNESLFFEWYKSLSNVNFESKLIWTVLVWNIPLPIVYKDNEISKTILPYTDFEDKSYIYNLENSKYEYNKDNTTWTDPEVWHWVISPNTWDYDDNIDSLKDYFDKNHDFYVWEWLYDLDKNSINWDLDEDLSENYEPYVFYFDSFRESESLNYNSYIWYKWYLENKEDIVYNRYTKELANKLKEELLWDSTKSITELAKKVDPSLDENLLKNVDTSLNNIPDIQSRYIINNSVKKFLEIFSKGSISELRQNVYNAWRYNYWQEVNADFIPYFISVLDIVNDQVIKEMSDDMELQIDNLVANWLSRKIAIPTTYQIWYDHSIDWNNVKSIYENYLFWTKASNITEASQCSYYRWSLSNSWQLVEANRGTNIYKIEWDKDTLWAYWNICYTNLQSWNSLEWLWWRNSPFNLNQSESGKWNIVLNNNADYKWAIIPLYDIDWSKEISDSTKIPSPYFCVDNNYLLADKWEYTWFDSMFIENTYRIPTYWTNWLLSKTQSPGWQCITDTNLNKTFVNNKTFEQNYLDIKSDDYFIDSCRKIRFFLDGKEINELKKWFLQPSCWDDWVCLCDAYTVTDADWNTTTTNSSRQTYTYNYKTIDSFIKHKSPTSTELTAQLKSMVAPSLAVDKDRYIDFIAADGSYAKINYPYLYRLKLENITDISLDKVSEELDKLLDNKSQEINQIISVNNPSKWKNSTIASKFVNDPVVNKYLKTWDYPSPNFDLKKYLKEKWTKDISLNGETKELSYYDMLVFAIYWNNLNSVSSKYWFIFENYLSNQFSNEEKYFLPKNKTWYEIAYLGSSWDASNMFIWLDPEAKNTNPYSDTISKNQDLSTKLLWLNIWKSKTTNESLFKCAPPEWVPIWEWIPAVMCRLWEMMPPTISISDGACWPSLLSNEEKEELNSCNWDVNKNWVNDCSETKLSSWKIVLESDSSKYYYNKQIELKSTLKWQDDKVLTFLNSTNVDFEIVKLEIANDETKDLTDTNKKVLFDSEDIYKNDKSVLSKYLYFKDFTVRSTAWVAKYWITVKDKDINVYLKSSVKIKDKNDELAVDLESNILKLEVRWDRLFLSTYNLINQDNKLVINPGDTSVLWSDKANIYLIDWYSSTIDSTSNLINNNTTSQEKLVIKVDNISRNWNFVQNQFPLKLELFNNNKLLNESTIITINWIKALYTIKKSWTYRLKITDNLWAVSDKTFEVLPNKPEKLDLNISTNFLQTGWAVSTNFVTILDKFDNPVSWNFYDLKMNIDWKSIVFLDNDKDSFNTSTYEWYKIFRLKSTNKFWENEVEIWLYDDKWEFLLKTSKKIWVIEEYKIETKSLLWDMYVWWGKYKYQIEVRDKSWKIINNFNSRVYMTANSNYIELDKPYFEIENWAGVVEFTTKTTAWKNIPVQIQIEWLWEIFSKTIDILPEEAMKIDIVLSKSKLEANTKDYSNVTVELKDRYNNLVFTDSKTKVDLEILPIYTHLITSDKNSLVVKDWKANFKVYSTVNPWIWYFKVSTNPSLELNKFLIEDESWNLEVSWVWENAAKVESFYVWNKEKIDKSSYNSIYTTLLWSNYWDIEQKDYLAGSLIFNKNSKALAVTSIINNPYLHNNVFSIWNNWGILKMYSKNDLSQDINMDVSFNDNKLYIDLFNASLNTHIWKINYNFPNSTNLEVCDLSNPNCINDMEETTIFWKNIVDDFKFYTWEGKLYLRDNLWKTYLEIDEKWNISRKLNLEFEVLSNSNSNLDLNLKIWDRVVWLLGFNFINSEINITRDELAFDNKSKTTKNAILIYIESSFYWSYISWKWENESIVIYYNDPFSWTNTLNTFSKWNNSSYENFREVGWLGWSGWNKTLLSFSSWKTVWESLKEFMSFSSINIWDPVISLKKIRKNFNNSNELKQFDSTIWDIISNENWLEWYRVFDYNNDSKQDILLVKSSWYLKLLENIETSSNFMDYWNLAHIIDLWNKELIKTWDFTWDSYDDIFFVWNDWKPYLLNNLNKDFSRISLSNKFNLNWRIIRAESFDMDNDLIDDIVTLDDAWEINIFYWKNTPSNPTFTKLNVTDDYWITLNSDPRSDWSLVYFDWLYQVDTLYDNSDILEENEKYLSKIGTPGKTMKESPDEELVNSFIFEQIAYSKNDINFDDEDIQSLINMPQTVEQTTFIKWNYSESAWVKIEKILLDRNWWFVTKWDFVDVEIKITNVSWKNLQNMAYLEDIMDYFTLEEWTISNSKNLEIRRTNNNYDFLIENFSLSNNESLTINYSSVVKPLKYSYMQVWLFEKWEDGDDKYWDIILKDSIENCWDPVEIFRSVSTRLYVKWLKNPTCDNTPLPEAIEKNNLDSDDDWIPDYIENLTTSTQALKDYSDETLSNMFKDSDTDWVPDDEDSFNLSQSITLDLWSTWESIDEWLDWLQSFVNWLSCWFNNWACISMPLNWAPLAPGNDPVFNGKYLLDDLNIDEGIPIFSALTWMPIYVPACVPIPTVWPVSSSAIWSACSKTYFWMDWAGWYLWIDSPTNFFRLSVTPTLTGWVWLSACFWAPASVAWNAMMPWLAPLFPGWNCIVVAKPIVWCSNDWSDWNPASVWYPVYWNSFWVINWNCSTQEDYSIDQEYIDKYYKYINWNWSYSSISWVNKAVSNHWNTWNWPLFEISWGSWTPISVSVDPDSWSFDFSDVTKFVKKRIQAFPWFLMNWVTRQIEEIVNKLTDFPTLFIILPDFSWIYDSDLDWETNKQNWLQNSWNKDRTENNPINLDNISWEIDTSSINNETLKWLATDANSLSADALWKAKEYTSGIKDAYEFMWSLPLVKIEQVPVDISLPWVSLTEIDKTITTRQATLDSRKTEYERAKNSWSLWKACNYSDPVIQKQCSDENALSEKVMMDTSQLIMSLEANLEVLRSYKEIPQKINKYINKKEYYLEQILCNIETISTVLGWRIGKNWERFKAWVELFILIKAILKSWQLLIDVFVDYEQECKECKNERQDAMASEFEIISMVVPDIPVIQFPKWPDIILDLHNIRASLNIMLPEFEINPRPILLPELPNLYLPDAPNVNISFPAIPVLPNLEIPELPDLPSLPTVELPDLPPPPTLPKMFASLEAILDILKLITKAMCILKSSPFHPEWRAWDQIAFLTERSWYLPTDFLNLSLPQFSFPFIDAIEVTTYVNFEFEVDFIVELARQTAMPINSFTADFTNMFNINIADLDFRWVVPSDINIDIWEQEINPNVWYNSDNSLEKLLVSILTKNILFWREYILKNKDNTISNLEFRKEISKSLANEDFTSDPRFDELRDLWKNVESYTYSWEEKIISELQKNNFDKFETLKDIINTEIIKNKEFKSDFNSNINTPIRKVSSKSSSDINEYNSMLSKYNSRVFEKTSDIINYDENDSYEKELKEVWGELLNKVDTALWKYSNASTKDINYSKLLAANSWDENTVLDSWINSCNTKKDGQSSYVYEWIYILENNKSYRLFDYKDELVWNEETTIIDFDKDWDEDLLYFVNDVLYLKQNLDKKDDKVYLNESPIILDSDDNKFLNWDKYISSVNNADSITSSSSIINISFTATQNVNNYRLGFYNMVDKFINENFSNYSPKFRKKSIVDWVSWIWDVNLNSENEIFKELKDIVNIKEVGDLGWLEVYTDELIDIKNNLSNWNVVNLTNGTKIYSWDTTLVLKYLVPWNTEIKSIIVPKNNHIEVKTTINVVWITWNWYVRNWAKKLYSNTNIRELIWKPLFPWTKISYVWNNLEVRDDTYIELEYYDESKLSLDFEYISDWELYDLWYKSERYLVSTSRDNDYYYSKISSFSNNINSTLSNQILLSPQLQADNNSPELEMNSIRVPVYQKQVINLTKYIFEDSWIDWISEIYMDFDLEKDSSLDWNPKNDNDSSSMNNIKFIKTEDNISLEVWKFEELYDKKIGITLIDDNWNKWYKEVPFEIYSPVPEIVNYKDNNISWIINEKLDDEPVNLYRVRWWMVSKLSNEGWNNLSLSNSWSYKFIVWDNKSWLKIEKDNILVADILENTWKISLKNNNYFIDVLESNNSKNDSVYPKILLKDNIEEIFYETIKVNGNKMVKVVDNFDLIKWSWVYVQFLNQTNYNYYTLPENVSYNPWSLSIYRIADDNKEPLFTIFNDGRINTINTNYSLKYDYFENYVVIKLYDKNFSREVASVLYKVDSDYIIK